MKDYIQGIRKAYTRDFTSGDPTKKQIAVATYLIDKLALRAGNEKVKGARVFHIFSFYNFLIMFHSLNLCNLFSYI